MQRIRDALTGLYSRAAFLNALSREISRAKRYETDLSLFILGLDDFNTINHRFGHHAGDQLLKKMSRIVRQEIRMEDFAARYGDKKIAIILPVTGKANTLVLSERIFRKTESQILQLDNKLIQSTISGGVASYPIDAKNMTDMVKCVNIALYRAKAHGKNNTALYSLNKRRDLRVNFFKKNSGSGDRHETIFGFSR
jgi:diguanylate cyclase (GGDEF)-like protein